MSNDIFDDVDKILNEGSEASDTTEVTHCDTEFNESELEDIMAEIENLESDLEKEISTPVEKKVDQNYLRIDPSTPVGNKLQDAIENEIEEYAKKMQMEEPAKVVPISKGATSNEPMSFQATGNMDLSLQFKVGMEMAQLTVNGQSGLTLTLNGVELYLSEDGGCTVTMENGVKFSIPVSSTKKKSEAA